MLAFLKMVAAVLVALFILAILVALWVRWKFRAFLSTLKNSLQDPVPPFRIRLEKTSDVEWENEQKLKQLHDEFAALGFEAVGDFDTDQMITMRGFLHRSNLTIGVIYEHPSLGVWFDLVRRYQDGTGFTYSNAKPHGLDEPPTKTARFFERASVENVANQLWSQSPDAGLIRIQDSEFARSFEKSYAEEMNWRIERGGPTEEEIRRIAELDHQRCNEEMVKEVQALWKARISEFFSERQVSRFRQSSAMPREEFEELCDRIVAIHDRMSAEELLAIVDDDYYPEDEQCDDEDEDDDEDYRKMRLRWIATLDRIRAWARDSNPREAFRNLVDERNLPFQHFGTVDKPIAGDIWLTPEEDHDDEEGEYDEELDDFE